MPPTIPAPTEARSSQTPSSASTPPFAGSGESKESNRRLPRPTFTGSFRFIHGAGADFGRFTVAFSAWNLVGAYFWEYDVAAKTWRAYGD